MFAMFTVELPGLIAIKVEANEYRRITTTPKERERRRKKAPTKQNTLKVRLSVSYTCVHVTSIQNPNRKEKAILYICLTMNFMKIEF